jgi:hypothetical protein
VAALEDAPAALAGLLDSADEDGRLFRSPLRVYLLLLELGEVARRRAGNGSPFTAFAPVGTGLDRQWTAQVRSVRWAAAHGFLRSNHVTPGSRPAIDTRRIRQTVIEQRRRPVAHTRHTMNDHYLARSRGIQAESRVVVGAALRAQVEAARARQQIPVFTAGFLARAREDLAEAAAEAGLETGRVGQRGVARCTGVCTRPLCPDRIGQFPIGEGLPAVGMYGVDQMVQPTGEWMLSGYMS